MTINDNKKGKVNPQRDKPAGKTRQSLRGKQPGKQGSKPDQVQEHAWTDNSKGRGSKTLTTEETDSDDDDYPCDKCGNVETGVLIQCDRCDNWSCSSCEPIPAKMLEALKKYTSLHWFCTTCEPTAMDLVKSQGISTSDKESKLSINNLNDHITSALQNVSKQIKDMAESIQIIRQEKKTYAEMVTSSTSNQRANPLAKGPPQHETCTIIEVVDEYVEREKRKNNLVVFNIPESNQIDIKARSKNDISVFNEIVETVLKVQEVQVTKAIRLGKKNSEKPRPLLLSFAQETTKREILSNARILRRSTKWSNVFISPDLTLKERQANREIRAEMKRRRENGEQNLIIKRGKIVQDP